MKPTEIEFTISNFNESPGENSHTHQVDAGFLHELNIFSPHLSGPLLGVVVSSKTNAGSSVRRPVNKGKGHIKSVPYFQGKRNTL